MTGWDCIDCLQIMAAYNYMGKMLACTMDRPLFLLDLLIFMGTKSVIASIYNTFLQLVCIYGIIGMGK